jgi:hypothetical protein
LENYLKGKKGNFNFHGHIYSASIRTGILVPNFGGAGGQILGIHGQIRFIRD